MIDSFMGEYRYLSNFHEAPILYAGVQYQNSESAYQAAKLHTCHDELRREYETTTGKDAKALSRKHKWAVRADWQEINHGVMAEILHAKFTQNKELRIRLVLTYPQELIEGNNWHDNFWGVCDGRCRNPHTVIDGENWLGRMLMAERVYWLDLMANKYGAHSDQSNMQVVGGPETRQAAA